MVAMIEKFRHIVTIQVPAYTQNTRGARVIAYPGTNDKTVYASFDDVSGNEEVIDGQQYIASQVRRFRMRSLGSLMTLTPEHRIKLGTRIFGIISVLEDGKSKTLTVNTQEIVGDGNMV